MPTTSCQTDREVLRTLELHSGDIPAFAALLWGASVTTSSRSGEYSRTAYVTFKDSYDVGTAVLLSGTTIANQRVCMTHWGGFMDESDTFSYSSRNSEGGHGSMASQTMRMVSTPSVAVTVVQDILKTLITKGYILGKDAVIKAKAFDESNQVLSTAVSTVAELSDRIGLTSRILHRNGRG